MPTSEAKCYLLDVGQGSSTVVVLPDNRAIVIDSGRNHRATLSLLKEHDIRRLELVLVSHNDNDHSGGIPGLLAAYSGEGELGRLVFLQDRAPQAIRWLDELREHLPEDTLERILASALRLEASEMGQRLWGGEDSRCSLRIFHPTFAASLTALSRADANMTSGVVLFCVGTSKVLLPGDSPVSVWRHIHDRFGQVQCDVLACPHHGGLLSERGSPPPTPAELSWLFREALEVSTAAVVSVGTSNPHGHPRGEVLRALRDQGIRILCTQITDRCCSDLHSIDGALVRPVAQEIFPSSSTMSRNAGVGCAGTVLAVLTADNAHVEPLAAHQVAVDQLMGSGNGHPLCRP